MMKLTKLPTFLILFIIQLAFAGGLHAQSKKAIKEIIEEVEKAMKERDPEVMKGLISEDFTIGVYGQDKWDLLIDGILKAYPEIEDITYLDKKKEGDVTLAAVEVIQKDGKKKPGNMAINKEGQLLYLDLFDQLYGLDRYSDRGLVATVPFEMKKQKLWIKVKVNNSDELLNFVFDTGADGMALNPAVAEKVNLKNVQDRQTAVVGGKTEVKFSRGNTVHFPEGLSLKNQNLVVFPGMDEGMDGIIGGGVLRQYSTKIDFDKGVIELYDFNSYKPSKDAIALEMDYNTGLPVIPIHFDLENKEEQQEAQIVFDTGAGYSLIFFGPYVGKHGLLEGFQPDYHSVNYSMGMATPIEVGSLESLRVGNTELKEVMVSLQKHDPAKGNWTDNSGSFGLELIHKFNVTLDVLHRKLYMEPNQYFETPVDFYLGGLIYHFTNDGKLVVKQVVRGSSAYREGIKEGDEILMLGGYSVEELKQDGNIKSLKMSGESTVTIRISSGDQMKQLKLSRGI